ncbi:beta-ketoacyl synthase N-terminal-like domain-containing protein [Paenibacillus sp. 2TAF8]|jgi:3-oxoacyl-(acyl-carrier-protein) synthase|uniref:beta-ketoacyl synthase N-terminal-like domain-containing protein n=1 Tax=Paenibacillus sp. 2TAF8 TaxID=3233020 RepID=UPI003F9619AE
MSKMLRYVVEQTSRGTIDPLIAAELISQLQQEQKDTTPEDIAIIGLACNLPGVHDWRTFWERLQNGDDFNTSFPEKRRKDTDRMLNMMNGTLDNHQYMAGAYLEDIDQFDYSFFGISPREAALIDPNHRLFLQTAWQAIEDAGYGGGKWSGTKTGIYLGHSSDFGEEYKDAVAAFDPESYGISVPGNVKSMTASRLAYLLDLTGPSLMIDTACSSTLVALHLACEAIRNGDCVQAIVGGAKINLLPLKGSVIEHIGIASTDGKARSFDDQSDGTGFGEGVIAFALKPLAKAKHDGDSIYAVLKGSAINQDGNSIGITAPNPMAQRDVILAAWERAKTSAGNISYIEAHGTGTKLGDPIEIEGLTMAFRVHTNKNQYCAIGSVKSNLGHLDHMAGAVGLLKAVLALKYKQIPRTLHVARPNKKIPFENTPFYLNDRLEKWASSGLPRQCGVSSFGLSGTNCHVVLEEAPDYTPGGLGERDRWPSEMPHLFTLSAMSEGSMRALIEKYYRYLLVNPDVDPASLCFTVNTGRDQLDYRVAFIFENVKELTLQLQTFHEGNKEIDHLFGGERRGIADVAKEKRASELLYKMVDGRISKSNLKELARFFIEGTDIDWDKAYSKFKLRRLNLPVYPFDPIRCWVGDVRSNSLNNSEVGGHLNKEGVNNTDSSLEHTLVELISIWSRVMGFEEIDVRRKYFDVGGDSILATQLAVEINKKYPGSITITDIYMQETIENLASFIHSFQNPNSESRTPITQDTTVTIEGMIPFNELFYKSCFYNSFLPVLSHYNCSIETVLLNDIFVYHNGFTWKEFAVESIVLKNWSEMQERLGLKMETEAHHGAFNELIAKLSLDRDCPVIVWVDCYEMINRQDTYKKEHLPHTILICGYDEAQKKYLVIEQVHKDTLSYEKQWVDFEIVQNGYEAYCTRFQLKNIPTYYIFSRREDTIMLENPYSSDSEYMVALQKHAVVIEESNNNLELFVSHLISYIEANHLSITEGRVIIEKINEIIKCKQVESYRFNKLMHNVPLVGRCADDILKIWNLIRALFVRLTNSGSRNHENVNQLKEKMALVITMEREYAQKLLYSE